MKCGTPLPATMMMKMPMNDLPAFMQRAYRHREYILPSEWAQRNRILTDAESSEPGPWRNARTPYLTGIMDAVADPRIERMVIMKAVQVGVSEALRNILGYFICVDPGPTMIVMPTEPASKEMMEERVLPLLESTPALKKHLTGRVWDVKRSTIKLDSMSIYAAWAGGPQSLATRPCRYVLLDEAEKYPPYSGREADPIRLAIERTTTYIGRRKIIITSTPALSDGPIKTMHEECRDHRVFECPCPLCGAFQELSYARVRWPRLENANGHIAEEIERLVCASYLCEACLKEIPDSMKPRMISQGRWRHGPVGSSVGFHLSSLVSPWRSWSAIAAEFIRSKDDPASLQNFRNSWLGETFEIRVAQPSNDSITVKADPGTAPQARIVPAWASVIYATADTQQDHFWYCIRAWGYGLQSQLIHAGMAFTFEELKRVCLESVFQIENSDRRMKCPALVIDSGGTRTDEVYHFAARNIGIVFPIKGASHEMTRPWQPSFLTPRSMGQSVELRLINTGYYKDMLARLINDPDPKKWALNNEVTAEYVRELHSEHKVQNRKTGRAEWVKITANAPNHAWDLETYQCAVAEWGNVGIIPPAAPVQVQNTLVPKPAATVIPPKSGWLKR